MATSSFFPAISGGGPSPFVKMPQSCLLTKNSDLSRKLF